MTRLDWLTYDDFAGRVGDTFTATGSDGTPLELVLSEATQGTQLGGRGPDGQERLQFSVVFRGPAAPLMAQGTYSLGHDDLEGLALFLVPLGPDGEEMRYEAAFA